MATLTEHEGKRGITRQVNLTIDGNRRIIRLGRMNKKDATNSWVCIEDLLAAHDSGGHPDKDTRTWLKRISPKLRRRLVGLGLAEPADDRRNMTLEELVAEFKRLKYPPKGYAYRPEDKANGVKRIGYKPGSVQVHEQAFTSMLKHWDKGKRISQITSGDCLTLESALERDGLAEATLRKRLSIVKKLLRLAVLHSWISENPFDKSGITVGNMETPHRVYVPRAVAYKVLAKLPDDQWKLLFALSRFAGLRIGSEPRLLRWRDIDWEGQKLIVQSPKTEHHEGKGERVVPIFGLLRPFLEGRLEVANSMGEAGKEDLVLPFLRPRTDASLRKVVIRAIKEAKVKPVEGASGAVWPRLWHTLRSSCQTDLFGENPDDLQGVCDWLGNSLEVAIKHYCRSTGNAFERAVSQKASEPKALQKALHHQPSSGDMGADAQKPEAAATL